jgi:hypothetical protein
VACGRALPGHGFLRSSTPPSFMSKVVYLPAVQSLQSALPAFENELIGVACSTEQALRHYFT